MKLTKFKSVSLSLVLMMSISSVSFAQSSKKISSKDIAEKKTEMMKESLDLTKKQAKKVYDINLNYIELKRAGEKQRPSLPKDGKHFKGAVCQPNPEMPSAVECEKPKQDCKSVFPNGKPQMKGDCPKHKQCPEMKSKCQNQKPCPQMKPECGKQKCDSSFIKGKPNHMKGCYHNNKYMKPDPLTCKYYKDMKEVLTAAQYEKWIKMQMNCKKGHKGGKPMPCPKK